MDRGVTVLGRDCLESGVRDSSTSAPLALPRSASAATRSAAASRSLSSISSRWSCSIRFLVASASVCWRSSSALKPRSDGGLEVGEWIGAVLGREELRDLHPLLLKRFPDELVDFLLDGAVAVAVESLGDPLRELLVARLEHLREPLA